MASAGRDDVIAIHALRHGGRTGALDDPALRDAPDRQAGGAGIRCPRCAWRPGRHEKWTCACLHEWNTFETGGVCPACHRRWLETQCPRCDAWSPHLAWYVDASEAGPT